MNNIKVPTKQDLASTLREALTNKSNDEFINDYVNAVYAILKKDPRQFRSYGVFWWSIKLELNKRSIFDFGIEVDSSCIELLKSLTVAEQLCAAYLNKQYALNIGHLYSCDHAYDGIDGDVTYYTLSDDEFEQIIIGNK